MRLSLEMIHDCTDDPVRDVCLTECSWLPLRNAKPQIQKTGGARNRKEVGESGGTTSHILNLGKLQKEY